MIQLRGMIVISILLSPLAFMGCRGPSYEVTSHTYTKEGTPGSGCGLKITYPVIEKLSHKKHEQAMNRVLLALGAEVPLYENVYETVSGRLGYCVPNNPIPPQRVSIEESYTVVHQSDRLLSVLFTTSYMAGSVHPITLYKTLTFDVKQGEAVTLNTFLRGDYLPALNQLVLAELEKSETIQQSLKASKETGSKSGFEVFRDGGGLHSLTDLHYAVQKNGELGLVVGLVHFTVTPKHLTLYFEPCVIDCCACGAHVVNIPWAKLERYLIPEGLALLK